MRAQYDEENVLSMFQPHNYRQCGCRVMHDRALGGLLLAKQSLDRKLQHKHYSYHVQMEAITDLKHNMVLVQRTSMTV